MLPTIAETRSEAFRLSDFASESPAMQRLLALARKVVPSDSSLLIVGETGVGKEWLARAIHTEGNRAEAPFVAVNCAAIPDTLLESELFGHERGAFTGAWRAHRGHFELAAGGTIFLDEIGDMSPTLQAKLLRVLQERRIQRVGAEQQIPVDVRVIAATHRDLAATMAAGTFRTDLYYRLGVVTLTVPPLRERRDDIPALAQAYLDRFRHRCRRSTEVDGDLSPDVLEALVGYRWPGNVRELINVVERAVLLTSGPTLSRDDLPDDIAEMAATAISAPAPMLPEGCLERSMHEARREVVERFERAYLSAQLQRCRGRIGETSRRAGLDPRSLYDKLKQLGLRKEDFKPTGAQERRSSSAGRTPV